MTKNEIEEMIADITPTSTDSIVEGVFEEVDKYYKTERDKLITESSALFNSVLTFCGKLEALSEECHEMFGEAVANGKTYERNTQLKNINCFYLYQAGTEAIREAIDKFSK